MRLDFDVTLHGSPRARDALVLIIENSQARLSVRTYHGGDMTPMEEYHHRVLVYTVAQASVHGGMVISADAVNAAFGEGTRLRSLVGRIIAGHSIDWDGANQAGRFTSDAYIAHCCIDEVLCELSLIDENRTVWDASDWLAGSEHEIRPDMSDDDIYVWAGIVTRQAEIDGIILVGSVLEWAMSLRNEKLEEAA